MNSLKVFGRCIVYVVLFAFAYLLNFILCGVVGSFFYDGTNETAGTIYGLIMILLPPICSTLETVIFAKKWASRRNAKESQNRIAETSTHKSTPFQYTHSMPPLEPVPPSYSHASSNSLDFPDELRKPYGIDSELLTIDSMDGHDFEFWCASLLKKLGFTAVEVTQGSGDQGVDILAIKDGIRYAIQCKCYAKDLGNKPIQEVSSGKVMPQYHCQIGAVMTNRYFTKGAQELAAATGTLLWDRDWIQHALETCHHENITHLSSLQSSQANSIQGRSAPNIEELLHIAMDAILKEHIASVSVIQRHLGLGYAQAAQILDEMESRGWIGPFTGNRPREILFDPSHEDTSPL